MSLKYEVKVTPDNIEEYHNISYKRHNLLHRYNGPARSWFMDIVNSGATVRYEYGFPARKRR